MCKCNSVYNLCEEEKNIYIYKGAERVHVPTKAGLVYVAL